MSRLQKSVKAIWKLAEDESTEYPQDVSYSHTARDATVGLVTKTEELTLADAGEARDAAQVIEKRTETWGKLREQMIADLKQKQKQLEEMKSELTEFAESTQGLVREVLATLH